MNHKENTSYRLEWSDALSTGIKAIDNDHKKLLSLIILLAETIDTNKQKETIEAVFSELEHYVVQHFAREEGIMRKCRYDGLEAHIVSHSAFANAIPALKEKLLSCESQLVAEETYLFLFDWLVNHIVGEDMKISKPAQRHGLANVSKPSKISLLHRISLAISRHITLSQRILMIALIPIIGMVALSMVILSEDNQRLNAMTSLQKKFHIIYYASKMNHNLQAERGLSSGYIASNYTLFASRLIKQRHQTDNATKQFIRQTENLSNNTFDRVVSAYITATKQHLSKLGHYRASMDKHALSIPSMMHYYTGFTEILRDLPDNMIHLNMNSTLSNNLIALSAMMHLKEAVGLQRAMGSGVLAGQSIAEDDLQAYLKLLRASHGALTMFQHTATAVQQQQWQRYQQQYPQETIHNYETKFITLLSNGKTPSISSTQWFAAHERQMDQILAMSENLLDGLKTSTKKNINHLHTKLYTSAAILISLILLTILLARMLIYSITYPVKCITRAMTRLSEGNREIHFNDTLIDDELGTMATAYEKCRISLLQADMATVVSLRRQQNNLKRTLHEQQIKSAIQDYALDGIITCDKNFIITDINPSTESLFRLDKTSAIGQHLTDLVVGIDRQALNVHVETYAIRSDDQTQLYVEVNISSIQMDGFDGFICFIHDISARKKAEQNIKKLSQAIGQAGESILITDRNGTIEYVNAAFTKLTGYSATEAIGNTPNLLKSGNQNAAFYKNLWETISDGKTWQKKVVERHKDGSFFPVILTIAPITNDAGVITNFVGSHADISDLEHMEKQFRQAQKMEAIGTLVGGIAHDFNNMLAAITGNLYLAKKRAKDMPNITDKLDNIAALSFQAAAMIKQLLTFARKDIVKIQLLPFTPLIKESMKLLHASIPENIAFELHICSDPLPVKADATQMHQVLMNLVNNACHAVEAVDNPHICIRLALFQADQQFVQEHLNSGDNTFTSGEYAQLSITDNGCGIPAEHMDHVFEPFFTNKEQGKGTGLGLAMVHGAIANHQGHIDVQSMQGEGTTFHIYIPLQQANTAAFPVTQAQTATQHDGHGELILLADDQPMVLEIAQEVLESMGYTILIAENGQRAVELYQEHAHAIDLCVFDVVMPVMGGSKAAQHIRQINPDVNIIFSTGYDRALLKDMQDEVILTKPFDFNVINQLIQDMLNDVKHP